LGITDPDEYQDSQKINEVFLSDFIWFKKGCLLNYLIKADEITGLAFKMILGNVQRVEGYLHWK